MSTVKKRIKPKEAKITRENIYLHLLEKQFNLLDLTIQDAILEKGWQQLWEVEESKFDEFKIYAINLIKRVFKCNKSKAVSTFEWFEFNHGLKIKK